MSCERTGRADSEEQHKRDCIQCGCVVCRSYLTEFYRVVDKAPKQTTLSGQ